MIGKMKLFKDSKIAGRLSLNGIPKTLTLGQPRKAIYLIIWLQFVWIVLLRYKLHHQFQ